MTKMKTSSLITMAAAHFVTMFILMYSMVYIPAHLYVNLNKVYMAAIMTAPMLTLEILMMGAMYANKIRLKIIFWSSLLAMILMFLFIRQQTFISDRQFLRSMIPHHSSAILMCEQAHLNDEEIQNLCAVIIATQRREIAQMQNILNRMNK